MMEEKMNKIQGGFWMGFTVILAATLAINGVMALMGKANFAWWHLGTLAISLVMSLEVMASYCLVDNPTVILGDKIHSLKWSNIRTDSICDAFMENGNIQKYKTIPIIGFQDLGAEQEEAMYMGNRLNVMKQILEDRGDFSDKITLVTSNLPFTHKQFSDRYGARCVSRMHEMFNYFEIKGKDRRLWQ